MIHTDDDDSYPADALVAILGVLFPNEIPLKTLFPFSFSPLPPRQSPQPHVYTVPMIRLNK